jgi:hypothetical protein
MTTLKKVLFWCRNNVLLPCGLYEYMYSLVTMWPRVRRTRSVGSINFGRQSMKLDWNYTIIMETRGNEV